MVCLETTFLIDLLRGREEAKKTIQILELSNQTLSVASPSIMELINGAHKGKKLENDKEKIIELLSLVNILGLSYDEAMLAREIEADLEKKGEIIEAEDIMIAAIAIQNNETLVTRNKRHYEKIPNLKIQSY